MKRVVFMGTPDYATSILESLLQENDFEVVAVFTQPDRPVGRKQILTPPHVKKYLLDLESDIKIYQPDSLKDETMQEELEKMKPDFIVVAAYGQILPKKILNIAPCINLHASILPHFRGASPIQSAILEKENFTGVTAMLMDEGLDTGDILAYSVIRVDKSIMVSKLFDNLSYLARNLTVSVLREFDKIAPLKQFDCLSSHSRKIVKKNGEIDLKSAEDVFVKFRAYHPWPGIFLKNSLKLKEIKMAESQVVHDKAGVILSIQDDAVEISCEVGSIYLKKVQPSSKKEMSAKEYILGKRLKVGDNIL